MSTREAAKYLDVSERTIHRLIERELIQASRFGNYWAIDSDSLEQYRQSVAGKAKHDPTRGQKDEGDE